MATGLDTVEYRGEERSLDLLLLARPKELDVPSHRQLSIVTITPQLIRAVAVSVESNQYPSSCNFEPVDPTSSLYDLRLSCRGRQPSQHVVERQSPLTGPYRRRRFRRRAAGRQRR